MVVKVKSFNVEDFSYTKTLLWVKWQVEHNCLPLTGEGLL